jgi:hypothetical protein
MSVFEIYIATIKWGGELKRRPVLIIEENENEVDVFRITSHSESNRDGATVGYFSIYDWQQAGLDLQSFVDTSYIVTLPKSAISNYPVGKLSVADEVRLIDYIVNAK